MERSSWLSKHFRDILNEKHDGIQIMPWEEVRRSVGDEIILQLFEEILNHRPIGPTLLDSIAGALPADARYIIMHRINSDQLEFKKGEAGEHRDNVWVVTGHVLKTVRKISVSFFVYDLQQRKRVSYLRIDGKDEAQRKFAMDEVSDTGEVVGKVIDTVAVINEMYGDGEVVDLGDFPQPPGLKGVMMHIYKRFADELPKSK